MHFRPSEAAAAVRDRRLLQPQRRPRLRLRRQRGRLLPRRRQQLRHLRTEAEQEERLKHAKVAGEEVKNTLCPISSISF